MRGCDLYWLSKREEEPHNGYMHVNLPFLAERNEMKIIRIAMRKKVRRELSGDI